MKIKTKPKEKVKIGELEFNLTEAVEFLETKGRLEIKNVPVFPYFRIDVSKPKGELVEHLISKEYTHFKQSSKKTSNSITHFDYVFYGPQAKGLPKQETIISLFNSGKIIELESEFEYHYFLDAVKYYYLLENLKTLEDEDELVFPLTVELIYKEGYKSTEFIVQKVK